MNLKNHETQLNIWLFAQSVLYFLLGFCFFKIQSLLPVNFLPGYVLMAIGAISLCFYAVRIDQSMSRKRTYAGLMQYRFKLLPFLFQIILIILCCATEGLLHFGGALAGIFTFLVVRELQLAVTNKIVKGYPAEYPKDNK